MLIDPETGERINPTGSGGEPLVIDSPDKAGRFAVARVIETGEPVRVLVRGEERTYYPDTVRRGRGTYAYRVPCPQCGGPRRPDKKMCNACRIKRMRSVGLSQREEREP